MKTTIAVAWAASALLLAAARQAISRKARAAAKDDVELRNNYPQTIGGRRA